MKAFKVKTKESKQTELTSFANQIKGRSVKVQAVYYSSKNPNSHVMLYDGDGDCFMFPIPGQVDNKVISLESPVTVQAPIHYYDENEGNEIIVFGETE